MAALVAGVTPAVTGLVAAHASAPTYTPVSGAVFTTNATRTTVNQNIYAAASDVYLGGGPQNGNHLAQGTYFFAVMAPGGQRDPNDGSPKLLSTGSAASRAFNANPDGTVTVKGTQGTHTVTSAGTIQLANFAATTNHGHEYIVAVCAFSADENGQAQHVDPRSCAYDAFKIAPSDPSVSANAVFSGTKWQDAMPVDGTLDPEDVALGGWTINLYSGTDTSQTPLDSTTTSSALDGLGEWSMTAPDPGATSGTSTYTICETLQQNWTQTGPVAADLPQTPAVPTQEVFPSAGVTVGLVAATGGGDCYQVTVPNTGTPTVSGLDFWNDPTHSTVLAGAKWDSFGHPLSGWTVTVGRVDGDTVTPLGSTVTADVPADDSAPAQGTWTFTPVQNALPTTGSTTYLVCETAQSHWRQVGPTTVSSAQSAAGISLAPDTGATAPAGSQCYSVVTPNDANDSVTGLDFTNQRLISTSLSGTKHLGSLTGNGLSGWTIHVTDSLGADVQTPALTGSNGSWSMAVRSDSPAVAGTTTYTVCETLQNGWRQSAPATVAEPPGGPVTNVGTTSACYAVAAPNDSDLSVSGLDFANTPQGTITGKKFYDFDGNGVQAVNGSEPNVAGWSITLSSVTSPSAFAPQTVQTQSDGTYFFGPLDPGTYRVTEGTRANWFESSLPAAVVGDSKQPNSDGSWTVTISATAPTTTTGASFGNRTVVKPGGHTMGYWANNGLKSITQTEFTVLLSQTDFLRNAKGDRQLFSSTSLASNQKSYNSWLLSASATNMAYMLSAQMTATQLGTLPTHAFTDPNALVPDPTATTPQCISVSGLIGQANSTLTSNGLTVSASTTRSLQNNIMKTFDAINNGQSFVLPASPSCQV